MFVHVRIRCAAVVVLSFLLVHGAHAQQPAADRFTILFSNDDGYDAPGLQALIQAFKGYGDLYVAAPARNQSGKGHSITIADAIVVQRRGTEGVTLALAIEATPATSVRVALEKFVPRPDLVISGINRGENLGTAVYLSGTLGAAREAAFSRIPAIAVSMRGYASADYAATAAFVRRLVEALRAQGAIAPGFFLNVNAPAGSAKGVKVARLSVRESRQLYDCTPPSAANRSACFSDYEQVTKDEPGTDVSEFFQGYITLTPMTLDVTDVKTLDALRALEQLTPVAAPR
jgi:5'-nucleotidase